MKIKEYKCKKHPNYKGIKPPPDENCVDCVSLWIDKNGRPWIPLGPPKTFADLIKGKIKGKV